MGTPDFAARIMQLLYQASRAVADTQPFELVAVFSRPDAVSQRGSASIASSVSKLSCDYDLPLFRPTSLRDLSVQAQLEKLRPDLIVVAAYGMLLPPEVLALPSCGCVNVHASLLPRWRGAAPIERAILAGDSRTGISIMQMQEGLDTGPTCALEGVDIGQKTAQELQQELAEVGGRLLIDLLPALFAGTVTWTAQDEAEASYAHKIKKAELDLRPELSAEMLLRQVRASSQTAAARLRIAGHAARVLEVKVPTMGTFTSSAEDGRTASDELLLLPGQVILRKMQGKRQVFLGCADGAVELLTVKPDNKHAMPAADWLNGIAGAKQGLQWD